MRLTSRRVSLLVICATCVFGTVGCGKIAPKAYRATKNHLPKAKQAVKELWEQAPGIAKEGGKKLGEEGLKQAPGMYKDWKRKNNPPATPQQRSSIPLTEEEKRMYGQMYRNWKALQSANSKSSNNGKTYTHLKY